MKVYETSERAVEACESVEGSSATLDCYFYPKTVVDAKNVEVQRLLRLTAANSIETISLTVPRQRVIRTETRESVE